MAFIYDSLTTVLVCIVEATALLFVQQHDIVKGAIRSIVEHVTQTHGKKWPLCTG